MALILKSPPAIFIHIFRTGGLSVRKALEGFESEEMLGAHCSVQDVKKYMNPALFDDSFKFAFVRNPFSWMLSNYRYQHGMPIEGDYFECVKDLDFDEFLHWYVENAMVDMQLDGGNRCSTQSELLAFKDNVMDFIGHHESLVKDWYTICDHLDINAPLPHINGGPESASDYRHFYSKEGRKIIETVFKDDLENFNYSF